LSNRKRRVVAEEGEAKDVLGCIARHGLERGHGGVGGDG